MTTRRYGPAPAKHHYCDCGKEAQRKAPGGGGWECDDCRRKNNIAAELIAQGIHLDRESTRTAGWA